MASADLSRINTNIQALNALNALNNVNTKMSMHQLRLATGKRINSAADDAAGFTIASKLKVKSEGLGTALDNIGSAKNLMTVAEGHLTNIQDILSQMKSKAQQAANDTLGDDERAAILDELQEFNAQIDSEVAQAQWAGVQLLDETAADKSFQIGVGTTSNDVLAFNVTSEVFTSGNSTFNSSGLDIDATGSTVKTVSTGTITSGASTITSVAFGTSSTINTTNGAASELASGQYTVEITSLATNAAGASVTGTIRLKDSDGNYVAIDADGSAGGDTSTAMNFNIVPAATNDPGEIDLGVGLTLDLGVLTKASGGAATLSVTYTQAGNAVDTQANAQDFMDKVDDAITKVSSGLSYIGSQINRLSFQEESLTVAKTNTESAYSRIVDADMAYEQLEATKLMILQQTATAMLAQANTAPQAVLSLFG